MDSIDYIVSAFHSALTLHNFFFIVTGNLLGTIVGLLPGIGSVATISMLFPFIYHMNGTDAIILLSGVYFGAQYGDAIAAITMKMAQGGSVILCLDGHDMHLEGKTGLALFTAGLSNFIGGTIAMVAIAFLTPILGNAVLYFGPREYTLLAVLGLLTVSAVGSNFLEGIGFVCLGMLLGMVGIDINTGVMRFTGEVVSLYDGLPVACLVIGLFGIPEIIKNIGAEYGFVQHKFSLIPKRDELKTILSNATRGGIIGSCLGLLPGGGSAITQYISYAINKKFNNARIGNVAAPAAADEAAARSGFIPLLSLGIPETPVMALMLAAFLIIGIQPGPQLINHQPDIFWYLVVSMWFGNFVLFILNVPFVKIFLNIFKIPFKILYPMILALCIIGVYTINNNMDYVYFMILISCVGCIFAWLNMNITPILLGVMLGPIIEENFRRQMILSEGDIFSYTHSFMFWPMVIIIAGALSYKYFIRRSTKSHAPQ